MSTPRNLALAGLLLLALAGCGSPAEPTPSAPATGAAAGPEAKESMGGAAAEAGSNPTTGDKTMTDGTMKGDPRMMSDEEWKKVLTPEQYRVLRQKGTERAFTGAYFETKDAGSYRCAGCGTVLFESDSKFDSGCGWPAFSAPKDGKAVEEHKDDSWGMVRTEVLCSKCGGHLGHVFDDGPGPTHLRYCINSASIKLEKKDAPKK